jgi:hypothetical protein
VHVLFSLHSVSWNKVSCRTGQTVYHHKCPFNMPYKTFESKMALIRSANTLKFHAMTSYLNSIHRLLSITCALFLLQEESMSDYMHEASDVVPNKIAQVKSV